MGIGLPVEGREWRLSGKDGNGPPVDFPDDCASFGFEEVEEYDPFKTVPVPLGGDSAHEGGQGEGSREGNRENEENDWYAFEYLIWLKVNLH